MDKHFVLNALLRHNFFPTQKKSREELPPIFSSQSFTPDVAKKLISGKLRKTNDYQGYDAVEYKLTRFNGIARICSIPHPTAYSQLVFCIQEHWDKLYYIAANKNSGIRPRKHNDGRIIIMDYEKSFEKARRSLRGAFGRRFMVHTDISNCFPSIYSHAIPWAVVGFKVAKKYIGANHKDEWFNKLDKNIRWLRRNETHGIAIGPATSNIIAEVILARVDETMKNKFDFVRFIDDYTAFCETEEKAREFIRELAEELARYNLLLNIEKTEVTPLPQALTDSWVSELSFQVPKGIDVTAYEAMNYLNLAVRLAKQTPDGSVLKYALKSLLGQKLEFMAKYTVLEYALTLSFHQPVLLPLLEKLFDATLINGTFIYRDEVQRLALDNSRYRRSDALAWTLYYMNKYGITIEKEPAEEIIASRDCIALVLLYLSGEKAHRTRVIEFVKSLNFTDLYELDQYWLLLYVLFRDGSINNPYSQEDALEILKNEGVVFVKGKPTA